jgi:hypothetical protein
VTRKHRKQPRRAHVRTKPTTSEAVRPLRVSIITSPKSAARGPLLHRDVELTKAALLYADEVELVSPGAAMLGSVAALAGGGMPALLEMFSALDDETLAHLNQGKEMPANFREMLPLLPMLMDPDVAALAGIEHDVAEFSAQFDEIQDQLSEVAQNLLTGSGADELVPALEAGLLTLDTAGIDAANTDAMVERFVGIIQKRLRDSRRKVLFDAETASLAQALVAEVSDDHFPGLRRAGQAAVGSGLISRLPAFPDAPMDELLELRSDLTGPLTRYRASTLDLSAQLGPVLGDELEAQVDDLWAAKVAPALLEIEETLADHSLIRELAKRATSDVKALLAGGAGLYMGVTATASLPAAATALAGSALGAAPIIGQAAWARIEGRSSAQRHELFYLYETNRQLS